MFTVNVAFGPSLITTVNVVSFVSVARYVFFNVITLFDTDQLFVFVTVVLPIFKPLTVVPALLATVTTTSL